MSSRASGLLAAAVLSAALAGCGNSGDLTFFNEGTESVTVVTDQTTFELPPDNGSSLLDNGCNQGDVTVRFDSGSSTTVPGPVCPEEDVVIRDGTVERTAP